MSLDGFHASLSDSVVTCTLALGMWGLLNFARRQKISEVYWGALVVGQLLVMTQGLLGGFLWAQGYQPTLGVHVIYGAVPALGIPAVYVVTRGREGRGASLAYGIVALVLAWLTWQAHVTA